MKRGGKYMDSKIKTWKERIKTNVHGQGVPYDIYCNETAVLKVGSVKNKQKLSLSAIC